MKLGLLFLRSRRAPEAAGALLLLALVGGYLAHGVGGAVGGPVLLTGLPLAAAGIIGVGIGSPFGEVESAAGWRISLLRLVHLGGLFLLAGVALNLAGGGEYDGEARAMLARNLAGFTGLALLGAQAMGAGLAWALPLAYGGLAALARLLGGDARWAWAFRNGDDREAAVIALVLLATGLALGSSRAISPGQSEGTE